MDTATGLKTSSIDVNTSLGLKADSSAVTSNYNILNTAIGFKANTTDVKDFSTMKG